MNTGLKLAVLSVGLLISHTTLAQPANDDCSNATNLGVLPNPAPCPAEFGTVVTNNYTTVGATGENPYTYMTNCLGAPGPNDDMYSPAADVWIQFTASGSVLDLDITSTMAGVTVGLWTGNCGALTGSGCDLSATGNLSTTFEPLLVGTTYYLQISGSSDTDVSDFSLSLENYFDCDICNITSSVTANPPPTNGAYLPGTTVEFCVTVDEWVNITNNWIQGLVPTFGAGWDVSSLVGTTSPGPCALQGNEFGWFWMPGAPDGPGWYVDMDPSGGATYDGDYSNNFGDPCAIGSNLGYTWCWQITSEVICVSGADAGMTVNTLADGEIGAWGSPACIQDPDLTFNAYIICCDIPLATMIQESCPGAADGSATVTGQGGTAPYDYVWEFGGATVYTDNNNAGTSSLAGLTSGTYTVTVTDDDGCVQVIDVVVTTGVCSSCPGYANVATGAQDACGGQLYDFDVANTTCNGTIVFDVVGDYGSQDANEITWNVTSNLTGNVVASGGPGTDNGTFNVTVSLDPNVEGTVFTLTIDDTWGDGFNGVGGFIQIDQSGTTISGPITGNFGASSAIIFGANVNISPATMTITTPSGPVVVNVANCMDFIVQLTLDNTNFCTPINIDLPWTIVCDETGAVISSGIHPVTVYPQIASASSDVVDITWNPATCQWDIAPQNDCDLLDIGTVFTITPDPNAWPANTCTNGSQDFTIDYIGVAGGPDCCLTGGALGPVTYNTVTTVANATVASSPFGGTNNSAYTVISPNGSGGNATSLTLTVDMSGYCYPSQADSYWVTVYVDGVIIYDVQYFPPPTGFTQNFNLGDIPGGYNENSVIEVYIYPNLFSTGPPGPINTTYAPGTPCNSLGNGEWSASTIDVTLDVVFSDQAQLPANCSFVTPSPYTCCVVTMPTASNPITINVECSADVPAADPLVVTDESSPCNPVVTYIGDVSDNASCPETITRTYRVTDDCGNFIDVTQLIIIEDVSAPSFVLPPIDVTVECIADIPAMINLGWTDNCDGAGSVAGTDGSLTGGPCGGTITRTWTYTDVCGNTGTVSQMITIEDTTPPVFAAPPAAITVECLGDVPAMIDLGWTDNCDGNGTVTGSDGALTGGPCGGTIDRVWTYTDACGNNATATQTITIDDNTAPVLAAPPVDVIVECVGDVPVMIDLGWMDNCDGNGTVTGTDGVIVGGPCGGTIDRIWTYTDVCGNNATVTQTITINDNIAPVFANSPADVTVECAGDVPAMTDLGWTDNCDGNGTVTGTDGALSGTCGGTITRTWTYTDACGNNATATQTITVDDTTPPVFVNPPADVTVECVGDVPVMTNLAWTDNCDGAWSVLGSDGALTGGSCGGTIIRTWTYTDNCGNTATATQTITVDDTTPPAFVIPPVDVTVECAGDVPAMTDLGWTDNCDGNGTVTGSDVSDNGSCPETITRTWTYTDNCGNTATVSQTILVDDTQAPVFAATPANATVECVGDVPAMTDLGWTDNCDGNGTVTGSDVSDNGSCPETITRTWTYTDNCGNTATVSQTILVDDTQAPVFAATPANATVECVGDVPAMTDLGWTDNCDGNGTVTGSDVSDNGSCPETITRTWTYTDNCGNTATVSQTILVDDTQAPVFAATPANATVECAGDVPAMTDLGWTDNCDGNGTVTGSDVSDNGSCPETITRTWTYTDNCGNTATVSQTILVDDTQAPVFAATPANATVECVGDVPAMTDLGWTDNCDGNGTVTGTDVSDGNNCPETITRTWTYTDVCGNVATVSQTIIVDDTTPPTGTAPADQSLPGGSVPAPDVTLITDEADNCTLNPTVTWVSDVSDNGNCPETITRTYRITDDCGNFIDVVQTITIGDAIMPTASDPAPISVECIGDVPAPDPLVVTDEADNGATPIVTWEDDTSDGNSCPETILRRYRVTDDCGNFIFVTQTITILDITAPVMDVPAGSLAVQCIGDVPAMTDLGYTDNCDPVGAVTGTDVSDGLSCPETITRTWTYTDACGNVSAAVTQTITVNDTQAPVFAATPANATVECVGDVPAMTDLGWTDNCDGNGTVTGSDVSDNGSCPETITRTWTYTDNCGNTATVSQTILVDDTQAPVFAATPANATVECVGDVPAMTDLGWTDNCDGNGTVTGSDVSDNGSCPETITRTWTYTDACGNVATVTQTLTVDDTTPPVFANPPADATVECVGDVAAMTDLGWTDNCDGNGTVTGSDVSDNGSCPETITRTWTYTDNCGNVATATQTITIDDTTPPVFANPPADVTVECVGDVAAMTDLGWTDNCDGNGTVTGSDASDNGSCPETITRTWTYTDACGNVATVTQTITVDDTTPPVFAATPADVTVECVGDVPAMTDLGWTDNCDGNGTVTGSDVSDNGSCPETITRTWTYTDNCGNVATATQTITIDDTTPPVFANPPANATVECVGDVAVMTDLNWTDNCDGNGTVSGTDGALTGGNCGGTITRTWTYTDACGNVATTTQTITVDDTTPPVFSNPPADATVECVGDVPAMTDLGWTDNCDGNGTVSGTDGALTGGNCGGTITRTWTYTDACGNVATTTQTITIDDTTPPVFANPPADVTVECVGDVAAMADLGWTDNCDGNGTVSGTDGGLTGGMCGGTITRTWTYTDACGNTATETQTITVNDTQAPVFGAPPADVTVECVGDVAAMTDLGWTDNCDGNGTVTGTDVSDGNNCPETITRTWTYTDACGNTATVSQTILVDDTTPPTASDPATTTVPGGPVPAPDPLVVIDELDNCGVPVVAFVSETSDNNACPETITHIYSVTDACGNTINVTHLILITDPFPPTASNPAPINVECIGDVPAPDPTVVTDEADNQGLPVVAWVSDVSDGLTCPETITRTYSVTDLCGGVIFVTQTITIMDITAPVMDAPAGPVAVQCIGDVPAMTDLGWTDNCDGNGTVTGSDVSDNGSCPETITRTWTYTDACGNVSAAVTQTITVNDTQAPVMTAAPADIAVQCIGDVPVIADLSYTDNCDAPGNAVGVEVSDGLSCPETITRTWTYTDNCGNTATETQTITVNDTQAPVMTAAPADIAVQCIGDVPVISALAYTDNCDAPGNAVGVEVSDGLSCPETITRTWTYTDNCGNTATETQTITVNDTQAPVFGAPPADVTVECVGDVAAMTDLGWTDNCDGNGTVTGTDVSDGNNCPETITRTWTYTDACGNTATVSQTILVDDTTPPTASDPATTTVPGGPVPAPDPLVVIDELDNCGVPVVAFVSETSDNNACPETITHIYSVTDACGNTINVTHLILITDPFPPTASNPAPINVECIGDVPAPDPTVVTDEADNQGLPVVAWVSDVSDGLTCPETITRTYSVTDLCGGVIFVTQTITIMDITAPVMDAPAGPVAVQCIGDVPAMTDLGWTDNCDGNGTVTGSDVSDNGSCPETITRTWTYTDACGNVSAAVTQTITVNDTQAPVMTAAPADIAVQCIGDVPVIADLSYTDNCDAPGNAVGVEVSDGLSCPETITRTWTYTDNCGNTATETQTITVNDTQAPVMTAAPADIAVQCIGDVPVISALAYTDNCDAPGNAVGVEVSDGLSCPETITRTWTYTDNCGNTATETQTITVNDTQAPVFGAPPADVTVECVGDVAAMTDLGWTDNCDGNGTVTGTDVSDGNNCPETITRTWTYTDACGNTATVSQTILVDDTTPPTASDPATTTVPGGPVPAPDPLVVIDELDNCGIPVVAFVSETSDNNACPETITHIYSVTDACGNTINVTHLILITDPFPPTASNPAPINVECIGDVPAPDPTVVTDEADNQGVPVVAFVGDVSDGLTCPETITRTYSVTDLCGGQILVTQTITVLDITAPVMANPPVALTVECVGDVPAMTDLAWTDNCDGNGTVTGSDGALTGGSCGGTIIRTWTYTDACGNTATTTQTITVDDTTPPAFAGAPSAVTVECLGDVPAMTNLAWIDNCDGNGTVTGTDVSDGLSCPETITRTWTYTDACGNTATETQVITVDDTQAPVFNAPPVAASYQCIGDVPAMVDLAWTDNCDGNGTDAGTEVSDGLTCPETITRTWTYTDACGNTATTSQTITVDDNTAPVFNGLPADVTVECAGDVPAMTDLSWTDNCDGNGTVTGTDVSDGLSCPETITRTWTYTDNCGNTATTSQTITVDDTTPPTASDPATTTVPGGPVPAPDPLVVIDELDNCGVPVVAFVSETSDNNACPETITHIYSVTDACGNTINVTHLILITDPFPPTASNPAPINVECIGDVPAPDPTVVTDEADNQGVPVVAWVSDVSDNGSCPETITRTYSVTDICANAITVQQLILIEDITPPIIFIPLIGVTVQCVGDVPAMTDLGWTDNCDGSGMVTGVDAPLVGGTCGGTITRTWTYTDNCGNTASQTQIITINDGISPSFAIPPQDVTVQCAGDVPTMTDLGYTDNCDAPGTVTGTDGALIGGNCGGTITRTWAYTDACGNAATASQIITINDNIAPVMDAPAADITVQCIGDVPAMTDLGYTDNCDAAGTVTGTDGALIGGNCGGTITRTWTYTDACGNVSAPVTQTITVNDNIAPVMAAPPGPVTVQCIGDVPAMTDLGYTDNCDAAGTATGTDGALIGGNCGGTITRTWTWTDACGNVSIPVTQTITVNDNIAPVMAAAPGPVSVQCIGDVPAMTNLGYTDNCDAPGTVTGTDGALIGGSCGGTITRTWTWTDACGNVSVPVTQTITINDNIAPVMAAAPGPVSVQCIGDVPAMTDLGYTDNCDAPGMVTGTDGALIGGSCGGTITRTWTWTDACGNVSVPVTQTITINDNIAPVIAAAPGPVTVECIGDVPAMVDLSWTDNCDGNGTVTGTDVSDGLSCPETITRTWTYTDGCGNTATVSQTIIVDDTTPPTASNPVSISVPGALDVPLPDPLVVTNEADNCTLNPVVAWVSDVSDGNVCNFEKITRTYSVTDDCGNQTLVTQIITINAVPAPIDAGVDQVVCSGDFVTLTAINPLGAIIAWSPAPVQDNVPFQATQTQTYTVTADYFGCLSSDDVTVVVEDLPEVSFTFDGSGCAPLTVTFTNTSTSSGALVDCIWDIEGGVTLSGCGTVSYTFESGGLYDVTLTTTSANGCSNSATYVDLIYVEDKPIASFIASGIDLTNLMTEVHFENTSIGAVNYLWNFGDNTASTEVNPIHVFPDDVSGSYVIELIAYSPLGCTDTAWLVINVSEELIYYVPNTFTPDGDNHNETFKPIFTAGYDPYDFTLLIFNRWGEIIWESHDVEVGWDGTYGGKLMQDGVYTWKIDFKTTASDERIMITGHVNLIK